MVDAVDCDLSYYSLLLDFRLILLIVFWREGGRGWTLEREKVEGEKLEGVELEETEIGM